MQRVERFRGRCKFVDETDSVEAAASSLKAEELLFARGFALGEAMNVIELMHPRMDPGMRARLDVDSELRKRVESGAIRVDLSLSETSQVWNGLFQQFVSDDRFGTVPKQLSIYVKGLLSNFDPRLPA
jgi:hypothetical protein